MKIVYNFLIKTNKNLKDHLNYPSIDPLDVNHCIYASHFVSVGSRSLMNVTLYK